MSGPLAWVASALTTELQLPAYPQPLTWIMADFNYFNLHNVMLPVLVKQAGEYPRELNLMDILHWNNCEYEGKEGVQL